MVNFTNPYWSNKMKVSYLQRRIIIASIQYYHLDESCIPDSVYEEFSKQLLLYMKDTPKEELKQSEYWYCMFDYDGSTGFHLYDRLIKSDQERLMMYAQMILGQFKSKK